MSDTSGVSSFTARGGKGKYRIFAQVICIGEDISIALWGGTSPHIGSVAVAIPWPSRKKEATVSSTTSVFNFSGHKDEQVARMVAEHVAAVLNRNTVVTAGIHIDNITKAGIRRILLNAEALCTVISNGLTIRL